MIKISLFLSVLLSHIMIAHAEIYTYKDRFGRFYFTDNKMGETYRLLSVFRPHLTQTSNNTYDANTYKRNKAAFLPLITQAARKHHIEPKLLHALVDIESAFNPNAISKVGAIGLTQLMPKTAQSLNVENSWDPSQNIHGGALLISQLLEKFDGNKHLALAAYNAGETAVRKAGNNIPNYPETQRYVVKVLDKYQSLQ